MTEYIDIDAPIDVAVYQRNRRIQVTLRQILESNDAKYECSDVVERKKGKWGDNTKDGSWKCSECGFIFYSVGFYKIYNTKFRMRFCPNCGADMRGRKDD